MSTQLSKRAIARLKKECTNSFPEGITAQPITDDASSPDYMRFWKANVSGPPDSIYEGGQFSVILSYPEDYPFKPPQVCFESPAQIYHPNVGPNGGMICLDTLKDAWSPSFQIQTVLLQIQGLLAVPNEDDPLNRRAAEHMKSDPVSFKAEVKKRMLEFDHPKNAALSPEVAVASVACLAADSTDTPNVSEILPCM